MSSASLTPTVTRISCSGRTDVEKLFSTYFADGAAQFDQAEVRGVMRLALFQRVDGGFADVPGRVEIRLADAERDDVLHRLDDVEEIADARARDPAHVIGDEVALGR